MLLMVTPAGAQVPNEVAPEVRQALAEQGMTPTEFVEQAEQLDTPPGLLRKALRDVDQLAYVPVRTRTETNTRQAIPEGTDAITTMASCKTVSSSITYENSFRADLARYTLYKNWCYTGSQVTSGTSWPQGWVASWAIPWDYVGEIGNSEWMSGTWAHVSWSQGKFTVCAEVCGGKYPIIEIVGKGNGTSRAAHQP